MASHPLTKQVYSLKEVADQIQATITGTFKRYLWIHAEIARLNAHGAHAYPNLTEKENGREVCNIRGVIFQWDFIRINQQFEKVLGCPLAAGMKVLLYGVVDFNSIY